MRACSHLASTASFNTAEQCYNLGAEVKGSLLPLTEHRQLHTAQKWYSILRLRRRCLACLRLSAGRLTLLTLVFSNINRPHGNKLVGILTVYDCNFFFLIDEQVIAILRFLKERLVA